MICESEFSVFKPRSFNNFNPKIENDLSFPDGNYTVFPSFCDVHVHFRSPGFSYKETISTGSRAAAHGGYSAVCTMPNLNPVPDCAKNLSIQLELIKKESVIHIYPYGAITVGGNGQCLSDMEALAQDVVAFSDDGRGVQSDSLMRSAMEKAKSLGKIISAHCEVNSLLNGGYIHDGRYAKAHNHLGISSESEWLQIKRDLSIAKETNCAYHVCHISCKESVELIRNAKKDGVNVTCETAPHYLLLTDSDLQEDGRFKMNPPLRTEADRDALTEGIKDGTIDMIATDHAPHCAEEKSKGLKGSLFGISGIETAFALMYTYFVKSGIITLERLIDLMAVNPRKRFSIPFNNDFTIWNLEEKYNLLSEEFLSKGKSTPFEMTPVYGKCYMTHCLDKTAYINK